VLQLDTYFAQTVADIPQKLSCCFVLYTDIAWRYWSFSILGPYTDLLVRFTEHDTGKQNIAYTVDPVEGEADFTYICAAWHSKAYTLVLDGWGDGKDNEQGM
jgi:hypothetical protein